MKRLLTLLFALALFGSALAEGARAAAKLVFSSFDGGGHVYTAEVADPRIAAVSVDYDYGDIGDEPIEGASYDAVFSFTGLAPGTTTASIYGRSPIMENDDAVYTLTVDEALNVTLTPVRAVATFYLYRGGSLAWPMYHITREPDGYRVSIDEGDELRIATEAMDALMDAIDAWDVASWDGFSGSRRVARDRESFLLEFTLTDGTRVSARGENVFPENYFDAMGAMWRILEGARTTPVEAP